MANQPTHPFPVVSDGNPQRPKRSEIRHENLFEYDEDWPRGKKGGKIGTVKLTHEDADPPTTVEAEFKFQSGTVTYEGRIPGGGSWKGKEVFKFRTKTGDPINYPGTLAVDSVNPKRWG
jgi:hypothetical protein